MFISVSLVCWIISWLANGRLGLGLGLLVLHVRDGLASPSRDVPSTTNLRWRWLGHWFRLSTRSKVGRCCKNAFAILKESFDAVINVVVQNIFSSGIRCDARVQVFIIVPIGD